MTRRLPTIVISVLVALLCSIQSRAHPSGNIAFYDEVVYWPYVDPIDDPDHHACVMRYDFKGEPEVFFHSEHPASDFFLFAGEGALYLIERRFRNATDQHEFRFLKSQNGGVPIIIRDWQVDEWRIGEGGFRVMPDETIVFGRYPEVYEMDEEGEVSRKFNLDYSVSGMKYIEGEGYLLMVEEGCKLVDESGTTLKVWSGLISESVSDPPLNRNAIFGADYYNGNLLYAYWGGRYFGLIEKGDRKSLLREANPSHAPHWVAICHKGYLIFSSSILAGRNPHPDFRLIGFDGSERVIWSE